MVDFSFCVLSIGVGGLFFRLLAVEKIPLIFRFRICAFYFCSSRRQWCLFGVLHGTEPESRVTVTKLELFGHSWVWGKKKGR